MPSLTHKCPGLQDKTLEVTEKSLIIGRVPESDIMVKDSFVSRVHCGIGYSQTNFTLKDLGSTNGTYRNGARVFQCSLASGDKIQVGNTTLVFVTEQGSELAELQEVPRITAPAPSAPASTPRPSEKQLTIPVTRPGQNDSPGGAPRAQL